MRTLRGVRISEGIKYQGRRLSIGYRSLERVYIVLIRTKKHQLDVLDLFVKDAIAAADI